MKITALYVAAGRLPSLMVYQQLHYRAVMSLHDATQGVNSIDTFRL